MTTADGPQILDVPIGIDALGTRRETDSSSVAAYGFDFPDGVDETYPVPVNGDVYTDTKVNSEAVVLAPHAAGEIEVTVNRPGDVWGPGSVWVRSPITEMHKPTGFPLPNGGNGIFSPVYIDNFVDGLVFAVASQDAVGQVLNITDGIGVRCGEFFGRMAAMCDGKIRTIPMSVAAPAADVLGSGRRRLICRPGQCGCSTVPGRIQSKRCKRCSVTIRGSHSTRGWCMSRTGFEVRGPFDRPHRSEKA